MIKNKILDIKFIKRGWKLLSFQTNNKFQIGLIFQNMNYMIERMDWILGDILRGYTKINIISISVNPLKYLLIFF